MIAYRLIKHLFERKVLSIIQFTLENNIVYLHQVKCIRFQQKTGAQQSEKSASVCDPDFKQ